MRRTSNSSRTALITFCCLGLAMALGTLAAEPKVPSGEEILDKLREGHPRLLVRPGDFLELKERIAGNDRLQKWHSRLKRHARRILKKEPVEYRIPDGKRLLSVSRELLDRVYTLSLLYRLSGENRYLQGAWREMKAAAQFKDWNPSHFLDTAEMTHGFAIGYDWLYDDLSELQRGEIRSAIMRLGLTPGLKSYRGEAGYGWWVRAHHNWNQVCNGGLAMGALAIANEHPDVAREILHEGLKSLRRPMARYAPDGGWNEGPGYWHYATRYNVVHLAALRSALGTDFGYSDYEGFSETGLFPIYMTGPSGKSFNFADCHAGTIRAPELFWLGNVFDRPSYAEFQLRHVRGSAKDLLWYRPDDPEGTIEKLPTAARFRGSHAATMRTEWNSPDATFVGFKAGSPYVNHGNADLGSFILESMGVRWAIDLGSDNYNMPGYFDRGNRRWTYYRMRAEGHNTLVVNPDKGPDQKIRAETKISRFEIGEKETVAMTDLTPAYKDDVSSVRRGVRLLKDGTVMVQDELDAPERVDVWWFMHTRADVEVRENGHVAILKQDGKKLLARILMPKEAKFTVRPAEPLPSSPDPDMQADNKGVRKLAIHIEDVNGMTLGVAFYPAESESRKITIKSLSNW